MENLSQVDPAALNISSSNFTPTTATVSSSTAASLNASIWQLDNSINGPVIAMFVAIEFVLSVPSNLFILIHSLRHWKQSLNQSSTIFLFNLSLSNFLLSLFYLFFYIISSGAEEWIFGSTDYLRNIFCQIHGFVFGATNSVSLHTLAVISFDRFMSIVKHRLHKKFLTWKTAFGTVVFLWLIGILVNILPLFNLGIGLYDWSNLVGGCLPRWVGNRTYVILLSIFSSIPYTIILITSAWTFIFTREFLRQNLRRHEETLNSENLDVQKHIYSNRIHNLIGIFGMLLLFNLLTASPFLIIGILGPIIGLDKIPAQVYVTVFILFLFNNVTNPIIQAYFRKDLWDAIKKLFMRVVSIFKRREVEHQEIVSTGMSGSLENGVVVREGGAERDTCQGLTVVEEGGEGRRGTGSSHNGVITCQLPLGVISETSTEANVYMCLDVAIECREEGGVGSEGKSFETEGIGEEGNIDAIMSSHPTTPSSF